MQNLLSMSTEDPEIRVFDSLWHLQCYTSLHVESCPPVQTADLANCWNTEPCCFVEPIYIRDSFGFGCFKGCLKKCSSKFVTWIHLFLLNKYIYTLTINGPCSLNTTAQQQRSVSLHSKWKACYMYIDTGNGVFKLFRHWL